MKQEFKQEFHEAGVQAEASSPKGWEDGTTLVLS